MFKVNNGNVSDVVLVFFLLTFEHILQFFSSVSILDFEQVNVNWAGVVSSLQEVVFIDPFHDAVVFVYPLKTEN